MQLDTKRTNGNTESLWENSESTVIKSRFNTNFVVCDTLVSNSKKRTRNEAFENNNASIFSEQNELIFDSRRFQILES